MSHFISNFYLIVAAFLWIFLQGSSQQQSDTVETTENEVEEEVSDTRASPLRKAEGKINGKDVQIQYGSPAVKDRVIWGDLQPYDEVWRTGANEATYVDFSEAVTVEGQPLAAGKYSVFTIPRENGPWTLIFYSVWDLEHGHYQYKEENDVIRVDVQPEWRDSSQERLSIDIVNDGLVINWEKLKLPVAIE
jgi:hypothetical protein